MSEPTSSSASDNKRFIGAEELSALSEQLAYKVAKGCPRSPTFMIALWRGGCQTGAIVQEFLQRHYKSKIDHVAARTVSRDSKTGLPLDEIRVHGLGHALATLTPDDILLIVDDIWDSGRTGNALFETLATRLGPRMPREVKFATVFYKPKRNQFSNEPDFYVEATEDWLVFRHELDELSDDEIARFRPYADQLLQDLKKGTTVQ